MQRNLQMRFVRQQLWAQEFLTHSLDRVCASHIKWHQFCKTASYIRECIGDLLLSFLSFLSTMWEHCYVCRREGANKGHYYSFKIFPQFWLAKSTRIIHHNQLLMTKFGRIWCLTRKWRQKCSLLQVKAPLTEKTWGRGRVVFAVKTKMADTSLVSRVSTTAGTRRNNG